MKTPLNDALIKHKDHISFHTPSHNGVSFFGEDFFKLDVTELSYSDNLLMPSGVIEQSQRELCKVYQSENTIYITSGATTAIHIVINALKNKCVLVVGACHRSVFNALRINNVKAFYTPKTLSLDDDIKSCGAEAVFLTSPDYFGMVTKFNLTSEVILVVDEAHGSHFTFSPMLPNSMIKKADIVIHSMHKTLNSLTGASLIHFKEEYKDKIRCSLNEIHSTSPSYLVMSMAEKSVCEFNKNGVEYYQKVFKAIDDFSLNLNNSFSVKCTDDKSRLVIKSGYDTSDVAAYLESNDIYAEMVYENLVVFIVTPYNYEHLGLLAKLLNNYKGKPYINSKTEKDFINNELTKLIYYNDFALKDPKDAVGETLFKEIGLYPPGVPIAFSGQVITKELATYISLNTKHMFGLDNGMVYVVR